MRISKKGVSVVMAALLSVSAWSMADNEDAIAKAPAAVQTTVKKVLGDKKCEGFDKETVGGKVAYEVTFKINGVDHAALISEAGEIIQEEIDVELASVPAPVLEAAKKAHADGTIHEAAIVTAGNKKFFELDVKVGKVTHVLQINSDGTVISDEIEKSNKDAEPQTPKEDKEKK